MCIILIILFSVTGQRFGEIKHRKHNIDTTQMSPCWGPTTTLLSNIAPVVERTACTFCRITVKVVFSLVQIFTVTQIIHNVQDLIFFAEIMKHTITTKNNYFSRSYFMSKIAKYRCTRKHNQFQSFINFNESLTCR